MKLGGVGGVGGAGGCPADRIRTMYPNVNETDFPLPRSWSPQDKCNSIGLSQNNLRVHYKGLLDFDLGFFFGVFLIVNFVYKLL